MTTNKASTTSSLVNNLEYGYIYLVKGGSDKLWWILRNSQPESLYIQSNSELNNLLLDPHIFDICKTYVCYYTRSLKIKELAPPPSHVRLFIWFSDLSEESDLSTKYKASYPSYVSRLSLDDLTIEALPEFQSLLLKAKDLDNDLYKLILQDYSHFPFSAHRLLTVCDRSYLASHFSQESSILKEILLAIANKDGSTFIYSLNALLAYPKNRFKSLFLIVPTYQITFYQLLNYFASNIGIYCPSLWYYFVPFYSIIKYNDLASQKYIVKEFFMWVFRSTVVLNTTQRPGLISYKYAKFNKINMEFYPSLLAEKEYEKILANIK